MVNGFALNHDKSLQIYFICIKSQAKNEFLKDVESTVVSILLLQNKGQGRGITFVPYIFKRPDGSVASDFGSRGHGVRIPLEVEFSSLLYDASLHGTFYYHHAIVSISFK